jgi:HSP20 family protein
VRWREAVGQLRTEIADAVEHWLSKRQDPRGKEGEWIPSFFTGAGPVIEVEETADEVLVLAELPGLGKKDFSAEVTADRLVLRGEKRREVEEQRAGYSYTERSFGAFARVVPLPCEIAAERGKATYKNDLLRVSLPKTDWAKVKRVQVQVR